MVTEPDSRNDPRGANMNNVTVLLNAIERGERQAAEDLLPLVYDELRKLASQRLIHESPGQTLQATALVHEAYVRLIGDSQSEGDVWDHRGHFFAAAAEAMRRILIENARRKQSMKHGGQRQRLELDDVQSPVEDRDEKLLALDEALQKFATVDARKAELVQLRFFGGFTVEEAAKVLKISVATAERDWTYAKAWLHCEMQAECSP
jgi:RNA polymerase sigma factor (TIGR02999 family)